MTPKELESLLVNQLDHSSLEGTLALDKKIDEFFGVTHFKLNTSIESKYPDLESAALSTSYLDYYQILKLIPKGSILVDLGAGYCRGSLLSELLQLSPCVSIEFSKERVDSALYAMKRIGGSAKNLICSDLSNYPLPVASYYYLYFPRNETLYKILRDLMQSEVPLNIIACESHGDTLEFLSRLLPSQNCRKFFLNSLPRHNDYSYEYLTKKIDKHVGIKDSLEKWWLLNFDSEKIIEFSYFHKVLQKNVKLLIGVSDLDLVFFNHKFYLQNKNSLKIYNTDIDVDLVGVSENKQINEDILHILSTPEFKKDKILLTPDLMLEKPNGELKGKIFT